MKLFFESTTHADAEMLVEMRILAMRESLERIGRFDPQRARDRFLASFEPSRCKFIVVDGTSVGFVQTKYAEDHISLEHFYISPERQAQGLGSMALAEVLADADAQRMPVRLGALRESASNRFYQRHGFIKTSEDEWDIYYARQPFLVSP
jgi:ribosomal protein S18 acetylase RimI-like enzyme